MYPFRKELVGKRFLFVRSSEKGSRPSSRSTRASNPIDYQWKSGVIRACNEKDSHAKELQVLVEYEGEEWSTRDWLPVYTGGFRIFLVEKSLVWVQRADPSNSRKSVLWPALTFVPLVDLHKLENEPCPIPVEFLGDHKRSFVTPASMRPYQDDDGLQPSLRTNGMVVRDLTSWQRLQKSQAILMDGPFTLTGFRVQVYRQNFRQWFSAVITSHDLLTRELNVMDDTVLQTHRVEPALVQVVLLANDAELDSLLRGETVRVLPVRQHRQSQVIITSTCTLATTTSTSSSVSSWQLFQELARGVAEHPAGNLVTVNQHGGTNSYIQPVTTSVASYPKPVQTSKASTKKERRKSDSRNSSCSKSRKSTEGNNSKVTTITSTSSSTSSLTVSESNQFRNYLNSSHTSPFPKQDVAETERKLSSPKMTSTQLQNHQQQAQIFSQSSPFQNQEGVFHSVRGSSPQKQPSHTVTSPPALGITSPSRTPPAIYPLSSHSSCHSSSSSLSSQQDRPSKSPARYPEKQASSPIHNPVSLNKMTLPSSPYATSSAISTINQGSPKDGAFHALHNVSPQMGLLPSSNLSPLCAVPLSNHHTVSPCQYMHHHAVLPSSPAQDHLHMLQYQQQHFQQQCQRAKQVQHAPTHLDIHQQYQQYQQYLSRTYNQVLQRYLLAYHQLQLLIKQQKTPEQHQTLNHYQSQVLYLYQEAQLVQKLSAHAQHQYEQNLAQFERHMQLLPDQIQEHILASQEHQRQLQQPRLEPEKLQAFFQQIQQQNSSPEQISKLYGQLVEQQQQQLGLASKHKPNSQHKAPHRRMSQQQQEEHQTLVQYLQQHQEQMRKIVDAPTEQERARRTQDSTLLQTKNSPNASSSDTTSKVLSISDSFQQDLQPALAASKPCSSKTSSEKDLSSKTVHDVDNVSQQSSKDNDDRSISTSEDSTVAPEIRDTNTGCGNSKATVVPSVEEQRKQLTKNSAANLIKRKVSSCKKAEELDVSKLSEVSLKDDCKVQIAHEDVTNVATSFSTASDAVPAGTRKSSSTTFDSISYPSLPGAFSGFINLEHIEKLAANLPFPSGSSTAESPEILSFSLGSSTSNLHENLSDSSGFHKREQSPGSEKIGTALVRDSKQHSPSHSPTILPASLVPDAREMATESLRRIADRIATNQEDTMEISTSEIIAHNQDRPSVIKISPTRKKPTESLKESAGLKTVADDLDKLNSADKQSEELKVQQSSYVKASTSRKPRSKKRKAKEVVPSEIKAQKIASSENVVSAANSTKQQVKCPSFLEPSQLTKLGLKEVPAQFDDQHTGDFGSAVEKHSSKSKGKKKPIIENGELCENKSTVAVTPAEVETTRVQSLPGFQSKPLQSFPHIQAKPVHVNHCKSFSPPQMEKQPHVNSNALSTIGDSVADFSTKLVENTSLNFVPDQSVKNLCVAHDAVTQNIKCDEFEMFDSLSEKKNDVGLEQVKEKKKRERKSKKERTSGKKERQRKHKKVKVNEPCADLNAASSLPTELKGTASETVGALEGPVSCDSNAIPSFEEKLDIIYNTSEPLDKDGLCCTSLIASADVSKMYGTSETGTTALPSVKPHFYQYMPGAEQKEDTNSTCDVKNDMGVINPQTSTKEYEISAAATLQSQTYSHGKLKMPDTAPLQPQLHTQSPQKERDVAPTQNQMHTQIPCEVSGAAGVQPQMHMKGPPKMPNAATFQARHGQGSHNSPEFRAVRQEIQTLELNELPGGTHAKEQIHTQEQFAVRLQSKMHENDDSKLVASFVSPKSAEGPGRTLPTKSSPKSSSSPPLYDYQLTGVKFHAAGLNTECLPTEQIPTQQADVREEKSAMETVSRLLAEKRESLQKAKNKKRQQEEKRTKQGTKAKEEKKKKNYSSSPTEPTEATLKINHPERNPSELVQLLLEQHKSTEQDCRVEMKSSMEDQSLHYVKPGHHIESSLSTSKVICSGKNSIVIEVSPDSDDQPSEQSRALDAKNQVLGSVESTTMFSEQERPVLQTDNTFVQDELLDSTKQSLTQYSSVKSLEKSSKQEKALFSSSNSKSSEANKSTDSTKKSSKKDKTFYSINKSSKKDRAKGSSKKSSKRDQPVESIKQSSEQKRFEQDKPENSVKKASEQSRFTIPSTGLCNTILKSSEVTKNYEGTISKQKEQSEEKRFTELKKLLEAKKTVEAKRFCEERCIDEETKHAVVKELMEEEKLAKSKKQHKTKTDKDLAWEKNFIQMKKLTNESVLAKSLPVKKTVSVEDKKISEETKVAGEVKHTAENKPLGGEVKAKEIELKKSGDGSGAEVVVKRKRGRPRKLKTDDKSTPEGNKPTVEKLPRKRRRKATGFDDGTHPREKRVRKEKREGKNKKDESEAKQPELFFIQEGACHTLPKLPKCRECREIVEGVSPLGQECCRFNLFRRLKRRMNSNTVHIAGFLLPEHAGPEDKMLWQTLDNIKNVLDKEKALYIINNIGDEFCSLVDQEKKALALAGANAPVTYKRAVRGVREMCDACATTIFNIHWVCHRCGFGVCLDCYRLRLKERSEQPGGSVKRVFEFRWMACSPGFQHQPQFLHVAQIIPQNLLNDLREELHATRKAWNIKEGNCPCCPGGRPILEEILKEEVKEEKVEMENKSENSQSSNIQPVCAGDQSTGGISAAVKTEELPKEDIEKTSEESDGQEYSMTNSKIRDNNLICNEKLETPSPGPTNLDCEEKSDPSSCKGAVPKPAAMKLSGMVVPLTDVCTAGQKVRWKEKPVKIQPIKFTDGLSRLMDYDTSSGESTPLDSPAVGKVEGKPAPYTSFAFPPPATSEQLNDNLNLLAHLASLHGFSPSKQSSPATETEKPIKEIVDVPSSSSGEKDESLSAAATKDAPNETPKGEVAEPVVDTTNPVSSVGEATKTESTEDAESRARAALLPQITDTHPAPHSWFCNGRLLRLHEAHHPGNLKSFQHNWTKGEPVLVSHVDKVMNLKLWVPESFEEEFGSEISDVVNCKNGTTIPDYQVGEFWRGFESMKDRPKDSSGQPMILKLKDWPPGADFCEKLPTRFENLMENIPVPEYTTRTGVRNLAARLPDFFVKPDLGPKMYNAYGSAAFPHEGTTNLHVDMSDAVNVLMYVGVPRDEGVAERERGYAIAAVDAACDETQQQRVRVETERIGAMWHIYPAEDSDKIRACLRQHAKEMKMKYPAHHDPIHDQCFYLDHALRERLKKEYNVEGYAICQCLGDAVFIPAGAPHQVRNLYNCVKVAEDFVSPEHIHHCFEITQEFRHLSDKHTNHEDKLQIKNIIFHAVKDAIGALKKYENTRSSGEEETEKVEDKHEVEDKEETKEEEL